jgi:hypothetical protein
LSKLQIVLVSILVMTGAITGVFALDPAPPSAPTLDNHGTACYQPATSFSLPISTSSPDALVVLIVQLNTVQPTNVNDTSGLTWNGPVQGFQANGIVNVYWAVKPNAGPTTINGFMPDTEHFKVLWFDVLGADLTTPFDPNPSLPAYSGPELGPTMSVTASTSTSNDFVFSYVTQVAGAIPTNTPTANSPFSILDGNNNGCYSQATWLAYFGATTTQNNAVFTPMTFTISNQVAGFVAAIQGGGTSTTTTSSSSSSSSGSSSSTTTVTTTKTVTTTVTETSSASTSTIVTSTCVVTFTMSGQNVVAWQGSC